MGSTHCRQSSGGSYAARHNPWVYFAQGRTACSRYDVDLGTPKAGALRTDVGYGRLPSVGLVVPNLCHDAHDCSLRTADTWLRQWVPLLQSGPDWRTGRLAVVITFDEVEGSGTGTLLTVVLAPQLSHKVVATRLDHYSWCRWMTDAVGAAPLRSAAGATSLGRAFGL
jgi:acid phosphatase